MSIETLAGVVDNITAFLCILASGTIVMFFIFGLFMRKNRLEMEEHIKCLHRDCEDAREKAYRCYGLTHITVPLTGSSRGGQDVPLKDVVAMICKDCDLEYELVPESPAKLKSKD